MRLMEGVLENCGKTVSDSVMMECQYSWDAHQNGGDYFIKVTRVSTPESEINPLTLQDDAGEFSNMIYCRRGR